MKNIALLAILLTICVNSQAFSQEKMSRKEKKEKIKQLKEDEALYFDAFIEKGEYKFVANTLVSAQNLKRGNIRLNRPYGLVVTPTNIKCHLPVYGNDNAYSRPTLLSDLEFYLHQGEFTIEKKRHEKGGWTITIEVPKQLNINAYTFVITTSATGQSSTLIVSPQFSTPATFRGDIE
ncbi:MAG: DUF4251 domain-containing protein [Rikenellaceae bacterium]